MSKIEYVKGTSKRVKKVGIEMFVNNDSHSTSLQSNN